MRIKIVRFLLFCVFFPAVIIRRLFRKKKRVAALDSEVINSRMAKTAIVKRSKMGNKINTKELDEMLNTDISTENIL